MTIYSTQLAVGSFSPGPGVVLYTVPAGSVAILRDISLEHLAGTESNRAFVYVNSGGITVRIVLAQDVARDYITQWQGRTVLEPGNQLGIGVITENFRVIVSGYLLASVTA